MERRVRIEPPDAADLARAVPWPPCTCARRQPIRFAIEFAWVKGLRSQDGPAPGGSDTRGGCVDRADAKAVVQTDHALEDTERQLGLAKDVRDGRAKRHVVGLDALSHASLDIARQGMGRHRYAV